MSSRYSAAYAACKGIDDDTETSFKTGSGERAWWRVDLGATRCVWQVNLVKSHSSGTTIFKLQLNVLL